MNRLIFGLMYRLGVTPWEGHQNATRFVDLVEGPSRLAPARALDVGCGTGSASIYMAQHGWNVTAVDFVKTAIDRAKAKTPPGATVRYVQADASRLRSAGVEGPFQLMIDNGCLHGLSPEDRDGYVREVTALAAPGARFVLAAFPEKKRRGPSGMDRPEIERRFGSDWDLIGSAEEQAVSNRPNDPIFVYELRRK